ncbi:hypothetical protein FNJ84_09815 [Paracoccus sp. M683]|nr:H-type lectin domain-containing protein [Paracoccus sp. M683]TRW97770.1 hypothetical protein FNJ84_09815 [Paracoccus sp. M683]
MKKISGMAVGICKGATLVFSAFESNGEMWTGEGPRLASYTVRFDEPFLAEPVVHVSMNMWDMGASQNARADISAEEVTAEGFRIVFRTWGDTKVARVRAEWLAIGPVRHNDDFVDI